MNIISNRRPAFDRTTEYSHVGACITLAQWVLEECGVSETIPFSRSRPGRTASELLKVSFNERFTSRAGDATFGQMRIRLSGPLWPLMSKEQRYVTIVHEACHLVAWIRSGPAKAPHGFEWRNAMIECGVKPERTHSVDRTPILSEMGYLKASCGCRHHFVTPAKHAKIAAQSRSYICRSCHQKLVAEAYTESSKRYRF